MQNSCALSVHSFTSVRPTSFLIWYFADSFVWCLRLSRLVLIYGFARTLHAAVARLCSSEGGIRGGSGSQHRAHADAQSSDILSWGALMRNAPRTNGSREEEVKGQISTITKNQ